MVKLQTKLGTNQLEHLILSVARKCVVENKAKSSLGIMNLITKKTYISVSNLDNKIKLALYFDTKLSILSDVTAYLKIFIGPSDYRKPLE